MDHSLYQSAKSDTVRIRNGNLKQEKDVISVVMPCYNAEAHITDAIECVLNQSYTNTELIVVNDGSTDATPQILDKFEGYVKIINQANRGAAHARNRGLQEAEGEFVAFLDADDYWRYDCLELLHKALEKSDAVLAYCGWQHTGEQRGRPYIPPNYEQQDKVETFLRGCPWPIHAALTRRGPLLDAGGFDSRWSDCEDYDLWLRVGTFNRIVLVEEVLAFYRQRTTAERKSAGDLRRVGNRWKQAMELTDIKREFVRRYPEQVGHLSRRRRRELVDGELLQEAYVCYWRRDLVSAQKIFRLTFRTSYWGVRDLKYILPCLLPLPWLIALVGVIDRSRSVGKA